MTNLTDEQREALGFYLDNCAENTYEMIRDDHGRQAADESPVVEQMFTDAATIRAGGLPNPTGPGVEELLDLDVMYPDEDEREDLWPGLTEAVAALEREYTEAGHPITESEEE